MDRYIDHKTKELMNHIDKLIPMSFDTELNYALKMYYLGQTHSEEETIRIIKQREQEIEDLCKQMELQSYEHLDKPSEERKSEYILNGETGSSDNAIDTRHENDKPIN